MRDADVGSGSDLRRAARYMDKHHALGVALGYSGTFRDRLGDSILLPVIWFSTRAQDLPAAQYFAGVVAVATDRFGKRREMSWQGRSAAIMVCRDRGSDSRAR